MTWESVCYFTYHSVLVCSGTAKVLHGFSHELSALVVVAVVVINCEKMCISSNLVVLAWPREPDDLGKCILLLIPLCPCL